MKITLDVDEDGITTLLAMAGAEDESLLDRNLTKWEIGTTVADRVLTIIQGRMVGWSDDLGDYEATKAHGWAMAQAKRHKL